MTLDILIYKKSSVVILLIILKMLSAGVLIRGSWLVVLRLTNAEILCDPKRLLELHMNIIMQELSV